MKTTIASTVLCSFLSLSAWSFCDGGSDNFTITDPLELTPWEIKASVYTPPELVPPPYPVVFILPPVAGDTPLDAGLAVNLCLSGIRTYILDVDKDVPTQTEVENLRVHDDALVRGQAAIIGAIDRLMNDDLVSGDFGLLGASYGGMLSAYIAGVEPSIKSSVFIASGGNLAGVLAYSEQEGIKDLRKKRMAYHNVATQEEYRELMAPYLFLDPLNFASGIPSGSSFLVILGQDKDVPTRYQEELRRVLSNPKVLNLNRDHVQGIIEASTIHSSKIVDHLKEGLNAPEILIRD